MSKLSNLAFWILMVTLMACGKIDDKMVPVGPLPQLGQPQQAPSCLAREYHRTNNMGPANQTAVVSIDDGWLVATSAAKPNQDEPVQLRRFDDWGPSWDDSRSAINAGLGQFALSGDGAALLLSGYGHNEGEITKPVVEVMSLDSGKRLSLESWQPGAAARDPFGGGYVYASAYTRVSGKWAQLGSVEPDGVQTVNFDSPLLGAQCAFSGGVTTNMSGDIAAVVATGDFVSRQYNILFLIYSRNSGRWSRATLGSYPAPELVNGDCYPQYSFRPLGIFASATGSWQVFWVDAYGVNLADIDGRAVKQRQVKIDLPAGATALSATQVPNGYLLALSEAPTERQASTIGVAFLRPSGEVVVYQPLVHGQMLAAELIRSPYQASTASLAAAFDGRTAALAYVASDGRASMFVFSNDCK